MDLREFYAIVGCIYLGAMLASSEFHEKFDTISPSDDQLLLIKTEATTESLLVNAASNSVFLAQNEMDASGDSIPTTKQQRGQDTDPSTALSSNQQSDGPHSAKQQSDGPHSAKQVGASQLSSTKQSDHNIMDHNNIQSNPLPKRHPNKNEDLSSTRHHSENPYLATTLSTKMPYRKNNASANFPSKQHIHNIDPPSVTMMTNHLGYNSDPLTQRSTKPQASSVGIDPLTRQHTFNDDPSTIGKDSAGSKARGGSDPVTMPGTTSKVDVLNDITVKPRSTLGHNIDTTMSKKPTTSSVQGLPVLKNIHVTSASEHSLSLSLEQLPPELSYRIQIITDKVPDFYEVFNTTKTNFQMSFLIPGTLYKIFVNIVPNKFKIEDFKLENYTVPVAPEVTLSRNEANLVQFSIKRNGTLCRNVHISEEELESHSSITDDNEVCKLQLEKLCPGRKYSMNVWQTQDVWKSRQTKTEFVTTQKRRFNTTVHGNMLHIKWEELSLDECPIRGYQIYLSHGNNRTTAFVVKPEYQTKVYTGSTYCFQVQTLFLDGVGERSKPLFIPISNKLPRPVQSFKIEAQKATSIEISLEPPQQMNADILGYLITTTGDKFCQTLIINCTGCKNIDPKKNPNIGLPTACELIPNCNQTMNEVETLNKEFIIKNLLPYHNYDTTVMAYNKEGCGNGTSRRFRTSESIPSPVEDLEITKVTNTSLEFQWNPPSSPNGNITKYTVEYKTDIGFGKTYHTVNLSGILEQLHPYKTYTIMVSVCNKEGCSKVQNITDRTLVGIPMNVRNVSGRAINSTSVAVSWDQPSDKRGPTNYSVETLDDGLRLYGCQSTGFESNGCIVTGLDAFWFYSFSVTAYTSVGRSVTMESEIIRTRESTPGRVLSVRIGFKCFTRIFVTWNPPALRERNGIIHKYSVTVLEQDGKTQNVRETDRYQEFSVKPEQNITVQIRAITTKGEGLATEYVKYIPGAPPVIPEGTLFSPAPFLAKDRSQQIAILLPMEFFTNTTNGQPLLWGLIVAQSEAVKGNDSNPKRQNSWFSWTGRKMASVINGDRRRNSSVNGDWENVVSAGGPISVHVAVQMIRNESYLKSMRTWHEVYDQSIIKPYRPTPDDWKPPPISGEDGNTHYILGADKNCEHEHYPCNGYLQPGKSYRIKAFMCTRCGCAETRYSGLFYTEKDMSAVYISTPILLTITVVSFAAVFFMWRKQIFCFQKHKIEILSEITPVHRPGGEINKSFTMNLERMSRSIRLEEFHEKVERMRKDSNLLFCEEFQLLRSSSPSQNHSAAELQANRTKNRYTNILAFDHSRVKLLPLDDDEGSDYINANYMPGYQSKREYIAAQGPLPGTKDDFWRMIWEQNVSVVVMVTQAVERGRTKCEIYWPTGTDPVYFGDLVVQLRSESNLSDYVHRILDVQLGEEKREVKHFHFLKWPDFGCPANTSLLINFIQTVRSYMPYTMTGPTIIHCSAGVGRTGTFIAIDWLLQHIREHPDVDIFGLILEMRNYRVNMVQTEDQYIFIHQCIADHLRQVEGSVDEDVFIDDTQM